MSDQGPTPDPPDPESGDQSDNPGSDPPGSDAPGDDTPGDSAPGDSAPDGANAAQGQDQRSDVYGQQIKHRQLSARVPENIGLGKFSTGAIVLTGASEFVVDFLVRMSRPFQVASRVVLPHGAMLQLIKALKDNIRKHEDRFGAIPDMPRPDPNAKRPSIQEVYDDLKLPDEVLSGVYANGCIIGHSPAEFVFDFVTNFYPRSAVSSRVFMSARQVPQLLKGLEHAAEQLRRRRNAGPQPPPGDGPPGPDDPDQSRDSDLMY